MESEHKAMLPGRFLIVPRQRSMMMRKTQPQRPNMIYPEVDGTHPAISSLDPQFLEYMRAVRRRGMEEIPVSDAKDGLWDSRACATDFSQASYISGWSMNPVTCPPVSNAGIRHELDLVDGFISNRHRQLFHIMARLFYSPEHWAEPASVHFNKLSSTGAPLATPNDVALKLWLLRHSIEHWDAITDLICSQKYDEAADKYGASLLSIIGFRRQSSDKVDAVRRSDGGWDFAPKERPVNDLLYALSGGQKGRRFPADRSVVYNGHLIGDMFAQRTRTVWGAPAWLTYPMTVFMAQCRKHYFKMAEFTLEHRGAQDIKRKLTGALGVRGLDISQYDQSIADWMVSEYCDAIGRYMGERTAQLFRWQFHLPWWLPNPDVNAEGGQVIGNPGNPGLNADGTFALNPGLPSGIAPNPDMGKFMMLWNLTTIVADELGGIYDPMAQGDDVGDQQLVTDNIRTLLAGRHELIQILNCGDDTVLSTSDSHETLDMIAKVFNKPSGYYFKMEIEAAPKFLGNVICKTDAVNIEVYPDLFSCFANWEMAERSVDSRSRRDHWFSGYISRNAFYQNAPEWETFARIKHDESKRIFGAPLDEWAAIRGGAGAGISTVDAMILEHPERLSYLPVPEDLDPAIKDTFMCGVDATEAEQLVKALLKY